MAEQGTLDPHRLAFQAGGDAWLIVSPPGGVVREANAAAARLLALPADEAAGRPLAELFGPGAEALLAHPGPAFVAAALGGRPVRLEKLGEPGPEGTTLIRVEEGRPGEEAQRQSEQLARAIIDHCPVAVKVFDARGTAIHMNER